MRTLDGKNGLVAGLANEHGLACAGTIGATAKPTANIVHVDAGERVMGWRGTKRRDRR
jgi:hypothetical protein